MWRSEGLRKALEAPAVASMAIAPFRSPPSASDAAATIRPSANTSGSGERWRSSAQSSATFLGLCSALWQSMRIGRCSVASLSSPKAVRWRTASRHLPTR